MLVTSAGAGIWGQVGAAHQVPAAAGEEEVLDCEVVA